jgi:hypothetical protein
MEGSNIFTWEFISDYSEFWLVVAGKRLILTNETAILQGIGI